MSVDTWVSFICEGWEDACPRAGRHTLPPPTPCPRRGQVPTLPLPALLALRLAWCVCPGVARGNSSCIRSPSRRGPRRRPALAHHAGFGQPGLRGQPIPRRRRTGWRRWASASRRRRRSLSEPGPKMNSLVRDAGVFFSHHASSSSASSLATTGTHPTPALLKPPAACKVPYHPLPPRASVGTHLSTPRK